MYILEMALKVSYRTKEAKKCLIFGSLLDLPDLIYFRVIKPCLRKRHFEKREEKIQSLRCEK